MASKRKRATVRAVKADKPVKKAFPMVGQRALMALLERCLILQDRASTATGNMGELVREAVEGQHLHGPAFGIIKRLHRLGSKDPGKLWLLLAHFDDMRAKSGLDRLAKEQGQLLPAIADEGQDLTEQQNENVVPWEPREVEERAGDAA